MVKLIIMTLLLHFICVPAFSQDFTKIVLSDDNGWGEGGNWIDYDDDGDLDLFIPNNRRSPNQNFLYKNDNGAFTKIDTGIIVTEAVMTESGTWGDYDNDGDLDLFIADGGFDLPRFNSLYRNEGSGFFIEIAGTPLSNVSSYSTSSSWGDYDNDGDLDLFCANLYPANAVGTPGVDFLYRNDGNDVFTRITTGPLVSTATVCFGVSWADYDNDNDLDLFVCNFQGNNNLYRNDGGGNFSRMRTADVGSIVADGDRSIACSWGDYNNDGFLDLFVNRFGPNNFLYLNNTDGTFTRITSGAIVNDGGLGEGSAWGDYDNDGDLDLFVANGQDSNPVLNFFYGNSGDGTFSRINPGGKFSDPEVTAGVCWGDYDNDGDLDLFVPKFNGDPGTIFRNEAGGNHWINVTCTGSVSNRSAIGAKVRVKTVIGDNAVWQMREVSGQTGYNAQNSLRAHFGLGNATTVDSIKVEWPSGIVDILTSQPADRFMVVTEGETVTAVDQTPTMPDGFGLGQNYPNPFNPSTTIEFRLPEPLHVVLRIYTLAGREVAALLDEVRPAGNHSITWDGRNELGEQAASGLYIYQLQAGDFKKSHKMLLLK